jgi:uncharacterized repeat protein (TIGR02543 family)
LLAVLAALAYILTGCPESGGGGSTTTVIGVTVSPESKTIAKGESNTFTATVTGEPTPDQTVDWTVEGNKSSKTGFSGNKLTVASDETAQYLTVWATSVAYKDIRGGAFVFIDGAGLVGVVNISGTLRIEQTLTATSVLIGSGAISYQWHRHESESAPKTDIAGATGATYTLGSADAGKYISVTVTRADITGSIQSQVVGPVWTGGGLTVTTTGTLTIIPGDTKQFSAADTVTQAAEEVIWKIEGSNVLPGGDESHISETGLLTVSADELAATLTIKAESKTSAKSGSATVTVNNGGWHKVEFDTDDTGPEVHYQLVKDGEKATNPIVFIPAGYNLVGWYTTKEKAQNGEWVFSNSYVFNNPVTENLTLYAKWEAETYTITYVANGSQTHPITPAQDSLQPKTYTVEKSVTLPTANRSVTPPNEYSEMSRPGYKFEGWHEKSDFSDPVATEIKNGAGVSPITGNKTFYAKWTPIGGSGGVYYWMNEGNLSINGGNSTTVSKTRSLTLSPQNADGYTVSAWYVNGVQKGTESTFTFNGADYDPDARHTVGLQVEKDSRRYYAEIIITILP